MSISYGLGYDILEFKKSLGWDLVGKFESTEDEDVQNSPEDYTFLNLVNSIQKIITKIEDEVFENYSWNSDYNNILQKILGSIIGYVESMNSKVRIVTTNYDEAVEVFCRNNHIACVDGFKLDRLDGRLHWENGNFTYQDHEINQQKLYLYKLHGSLGWKLHTDRGLEKINYEGKSTNSKYNDLLIYPVLDPKKPDEQPFGLIRKNFEEIMSNEADVCIVIGFSLRDSYINNIFQKFVNEKKILILIGPNVKTDFRKITTKQVPNVYFITMKLDEKTIKELIEKIKQILPSSL